MVNGFFPEPSQPVIFAGCTLKKANPADAAASLILYNTLISYSFLIWHGLCNIPHERPLGRAPARSTEWPPGRVVPPSAGGVQVDGEYASHWAVAADRAATRARRRRQQHCQREHYRLQGRRRGFRRIPAEPRQH